MHESETAAVTSQSTCATPERPPPFTQARGGGGLRLLAMHSWCSQPPQTSHHTHFPDKTLLIFSSTLKLSIQAYISSQTVGHMAQKEIFCEPWHAAHVLTPSHLTDLSAAAHHGGDDAVHVCHQLCSLTP
eukprot:812830-Pelagomonas_calceolata.AAC.3